MSNWYFNEVEMMNKHKMLNRAGNKYRQANHGRAGRVYNLTRQFVVPLGRSLVFVGKGLMERYEPAPEKEPLAQTAKAD